MTGGILLWLLLLNDETNELDCMPLTCTAYVTKVIHQVVASESAAEAKTQRNPVPKSRGEGGSAISNGFSPFVTKNSNFNVEEKKVGQNYLPILKKYIYLSLFNLLCVIVFLASTNI